LRRERLQFGRALEHVLAAVLDRRHGLKRHPFVLHQLMDERRWIHTVRSDFSQNTGGERDAQFISIHHIGRVVMRLFCQHDISCTYRELGAGAALPFLHEIQTINRDLTRRLLRLLGIDGVDKNLSNLIKARSTVALEIRCQVPGDSLKNRGVDFSTKQEATDSAPPTLDMTVKNVSVWHRSAPC
jgi:hypothetical protein